MLVDGIGQNYVYDNDRYSTGYINFIAALPKLRDASGPNRDALVVGLGAGQLPMLLQELGFYVETVEIDPVVGAMAARHFGFDLPPEQTHYTDGRVFLLRTDRSYEYIILDAFSAEQIASHLVTLEAFEDARLRLSDTGVLVINVTSTTAGDDIAAIHNTLKAVFPHVRGFSMPDDAALTSILLLASRIPIQLDTTGTRGAAPQLEDVKLFLAGELRNLHSDILLTDDFNPVGYQRRRVQLLWRELMIDYLGEDSLVWLSM